MIMGPWHTLALLRQTGVHDLNFRDYYFVARVGTNIIICRSNLHFVANFCFGLFVCLIVCMITLLQVLIVVFPSAIIAGVIKTVESHFFASRGYRCSVSWQRALFCKYVPLRYVPIKVWLDFIALGIWNKIKQYHIVSQETKYFSYFGIHVALQ